MLNVDLGGADRRIWDLHAQGFPPSAIAAIAGCTEKRAHDVVTGVWYDDKLAAREAKRKRAA